MIQFVSLEDACIVNPKKSEVKDLPVRTAVSFVGMKDVSEDGIVAASEVKSLGDVYKGFTYFAEGDILFAKITPCMENGKGGIAVGLENGIGFGSTEFHVLRPKENVYNAYINYLLTSKGLRKQAEAQMTGSAGQKRVPANFFKNFRIPLPPLNIQKKIAAALHKADAIRKRNKQILDQYDVLAQSVFLEMFGDPVVNPKGFEKGTIREIVKEAKYGTSKKAGAEGAFPYLRMNNITYSGNLDTSELKYIDLDEKEQEKYLVRDGDLLFNRTNSKELVGKTAVYKLEERMAIAGYLIKVRFNEKGNPFYVSAYLNSKHGKLTLQNMCKNIVGMANINAQELQDISILIPPIELQNQFELIIREISKQKESFTQQVDKAEDLFHSLLQRAFKGELFLEVEELEAAQA